MVSARSVPRPWPLHLPGCIETIRLPPNAWLTILREALATDQCESAGLYVGTTTGQIFYSRDEGKHWQTLADYLPPVLSIRAAQVVG